MLSVNGMKKKFRLNILYLLLFAFVQFPLRLKGYNIVTYFFVYFIPLVCLIIQIGWSYGLFCRIRKTYVKISLVLFLFLFIVSVLWPILSGTFEFTFVTEYWRRFFLLLLKNIFLLNVYECFVAKKQSNIEDYIQYYLFSLILYIGFTLITLLLPNLKLFLVNHLYLTEGESIIVWYPEYSTRFGWAGFSGFDMTMHCTFGVILCCIWIVGKKSLFLQTRYLLLGSILLGGNMLYGRTGLIVSIFCLVVTVLRVFLKGQLRFVIRIMFISLAVFVCLLTIKDFVPSIERWYDWAFSVFTNLVTKGKFIDNMGSLVTLFSEMYWMPNIDTLLIGDAIYSVNGSYYMGTDSGIMRLILFYGTIYYFIGLIAMAGILNYFFEKLYLFGLIKRQDKLYLFWMLLVAILLFEVKGESYYKFVVMILPLTFIYEDITSWKKSLHPCLNNPTNVSEERKK